MYSIFKGREFHNTEHFNDIGSVTGSPGYKLKKLRDVWHPIISKIC